MEEDGIIDFDERINEPGDYYKLKASCDKCGHNWNPRDIETHRKATQIDNIIPSV